MLNLEAQGLEPKIDHKIESPYQIPFFTHKDHFWIIFSQQFILIFWPTEFDGLYYNIPCGKNFLKKQQVQPAIICLLSPLFQLTTVLHKDSDEIWFIFLKWISQLHPMYVFHWSIITYIYMYILSQDCLDKSQQLFKYPKHWEYVKSTTESSYTLKIALIHTTKLW